MQVPTGSANKHRTNSNRKKMNLANSTLNPGFLYHWPC